MASDRMLRIFFAIFAFILPFFLYVATLSPSYIPIDSAEFTLCSYTLGICHPPGFPIYTLVTKFLITVIPFGEVAYRANLVTALYASVTIGILYLLLRRLTKQFVPPFLLCIVLATSASFWQFSISADVFIFNTMLLALTFFFVVHKLPLLSFAFLGIATSHFVTNGLLLPVFAWYFWPDKSPLKKVIPWAVVFGLPFLSYVYLYFRMLQDPSINWGHV